MRYYILVLGVLISIVGKGQVNINWQLLSEVTLHKQLSPEDGLQYDVPVFSDTLIQYHEKEIIISGYLIPLNNKDQMFVLSKNPYASCFFCGGAGPESVMEIWLKPDSFRIFKLDETVQFKGTLVLNGKDFDHCMYILKDAVEVL